MTAPDRLVSRDSPSAWEGEAEKALRPLYLADFIGQRPLCENLSVFISAARHRGESLDHILLSGPPGLGKTTLARIIANELQSSFRATAGPIISKAGDLAALLTNLNAGDVLFIDEIHRLTPAVEEILYTAIEDFHLDLMIGEGASARTMRIDLPPFTLVAATTRAGLISRPLRERFGIPLQLQFYGTGDLSVIIRRAAGLLGLPVDKTAGTEMAKRSRGTPRIALRLLRRVRDFSHASNKAQIDLSLARSALEKLDIDEEGLDLLDQQYLTALAKHYAGGPAGIETLCAALSSERDVIEDVVEPFLLQAGFIQKTARGRILLPKAWQHLNLVPQTSEQTQSSLFDPNTPDDETFS